MHRFIGPLCIALTVAVRCGADEPEKKEPAKHELTADEKSILDLTNQERTRAGLPAFKPSLVLSKVARGHSANMAKQGKIEHILDGKTPGQRAREGGYRFDVVGENVAWGEKGFTLPQVMKTWMDSKVHRDNILDKEFTEIGIGIITDAKGKSYYTQLFATPKQ
jgi:uncharacterized protein YkwD